MSNNSGGTNNDDASSDDANSGVDDDKSTRLLDPLMVEIGERIRAYRVVSGITQAELADAIGLSRSSIANIERGRQGTTIVAFINIAQQLNTPPISLLPVDTNDDQTPDIMAKLIAALTLVEEYRARLLNIHAIAEL